ncbi:MBL fold metallo-hydrolase [Persicimonas caeni]|uniref:MBL fold metallo-hydrolase n=1 Tax=Persicimonas caeni TaxID=2292766 RepID=A0A4Y6PN22_PERCE|nr:MBL fold metallo-hydrolase [Persicimonas caeni]QDG49706.1 MBL fold metallo-hydrolase [Persicimonas caeni]QED30927.1 MBL fold metallo-hydrolase [Persicimonas caeni]
MNPTTHIIKPPAHLKDDDLVYFAEHCEGGKFFNPWRNVSPGSPIDLLKWQLSSNPWADEKQREEPLQPIPTALDDFAGMPSPKVLWIGHASFLVELDGFRAVVDPVFGGASAFVPRKAPTPFDVEELPHVDAVLITHGHYDHLDRASLKRLAAEQGSDTTVVVPLGLGSVIPDGFERVVEVDWWTAVDFGGVDATLVPAQHWHRRGLADTNKALWGGWVLQGTHTLYHAGDSGYFGGFEVIGEVYPEIELAMLPVGAYEPRWFMRPQHMNPEESLQAFDDLGAAHFAAMHWGTFDLTDEPLRQGAERLQGLVREQERARDRFHVPLPGGSVGLS